VGSRLPVLKISLRWTIEDGSCARVAARVPMVVLGSDDSTAGLGGLEARSLR
jgi:hypothetical protein